MFRACGEASTLRPPVPLDAEAHMPLRAAGCGNGAGGAVAAACIR